MTDVLPQVVFATHNVFKFEEVAQMLEGQVALLSLDTIGCSEEIPETGSTLEENALIKARWVKNRYGYTCFADDTGLEVEALDGAPGVFSARYAGEEKSDRANMDKLLHQLDGTPNRKAQFRTVIAWVTTNEERLFEGVVKGTIAEHPEGTHGFGYDPIFIPDGETRSFAQLSAEEKNLISHRGRAIENFYRFLAEENLEGR